MPPKTRAKNVDVHPGDAVPKQRRRSKAEIQEAAEAEKLSKKQAEVKTRKKLTKVAQAEAAILRNKEADEASEPRVRPRRQPLKRSHALLDVTQPESDKENHGISSDGESKSSFVPEGFMDPSSDFEVPVAQPRAKPTTKSKKKKGVSIRAEIELLRHHGLLAIDEAQEAEEEVMVMEEEPQMPIPPKVKAWETRGASVNTIEEAMMPPAKRVKTGTKFPGEKAAEIQSFDVNKAPKVPKGKGRERAVTFSDNAEPEHALEPETPHPRPTKPHSRAPDNLFTPGPGPAPHRKATFIPDSPLTPEEASPVKFGGIADHKDGSDDEEQIAAKLSPVKAGRRVTSTAIVAIQPAKLLKEVQPSKPSVKKTKTPTDIERPHAAPPSPSRAVPHAHSSSHSVEAFDADSDDGILNARPVQFRSRAEPTVGHGERSERSSQHESVPTKVSCAPSTVPSRPPSTRATNKDLPAGVDQATFRRVYIETVIKYAARLTNPWENASALHIKIYQAVWNTVFPEVPHTFSLNHTDDKVLSLITQRTYEWRTRLAGEAINAVLQLENSDAEFKDLEYRKAWVTWALKPKYWGFTFAVADSENPNDWEGSFESDIVAKTFAAHFKFINRAITVKSLPHLTLVPPGGALALSLVAVERALELWSQDVLSPSPNGTQVTLPMFDSATWATKTAGWTQSFLKLSLESWGDIIETAQSFTSAACKPPVKDKVMLAEPLDARASFVPRPRRK
ncbi:hypothetical protein PTI98_010763 [Pleurotus ostreatus]|nr:hypothetical protein PTI98_010763 [Pleurotus ostreatus]